MSRSLWKPTFIHPQVVANFTAPVIYIHNRSTNLISTMLGLHFQIYNGIRWFAFEVTQDIVGHRLGEFASTRKRPIPKKKKKLKVKKLWIK